MEQEFIENELIIVTKSTLDKFLKEDNPADLIALYIFFYYTAKWQKTNIIKATQGYVKKGLGWGIDRLSRSEDKLINLGLIEKVTRRDKQGKVVGWFVKVKYIFTQNNVELVQNTQKPQVDEATSGKQETNALSTNNINALSTNNINALSTNKEYMQDVKEETNTELTLPTHRGKLAHQRLDSIYIDLFYNLYLSKPSVSDIGKRLKIFKDLLGVYTELQIAMLLITFFNWNGMDNNSSKDRDFFTNNAHAIHLFKYNINKFELYIKNVSGYKVEFENSNKDLLEFIGNWIINLTNKI